MKQFSVSVILTAFFEAKIPTHRITPTHSGPETAGHDLWEVTYPKSTGRLTLTHVQSFSGYGSEELAKRMRDQLQTAARLTAVTEYVNKTLREDITSEGGTSNDIFGNSRD